MSKDEKEKKRSKVTIKKLLDKKARGEMITSLGVYDAPMAVFADRVGFDLLVSGNAGPMSLLGHPDPLTVSFDEHFTLTKAVSRVTKYGMVIGHMPFMSYATVDDAIRNAGRIASEGGADAVKCESTRHTAYIVEAVVRAGVPVMGHIGMQAQRKIEQSGFGFKGREAEEAANIVADARRLVDAGVFAFIIEYVPVEITDYLVRTLPVPVLSVGAGASADGMYIGSGDVVGYSAFPRPKNQPEFVDVGPIITEGLETYKNHVLSKKFPGEEFTQHMVEEQHEKFLELVD